VRFTTLQTMTTRRKLNLNLNGYLSNVLSGFSGTESYPCPPQGWHERIRFAANQEPFNGPCISMALIA
jgi:hypothetical protein